MYISSKSKKIWKERWSIRVVSLSVLCRGNLKRSMKLFSIRTYFASIADIKVQRPFDVIHFPILSVIFTSLTFSPIHIQYNRKIGLYSQTRIFLVSGRQFPSDPDQEMGHLRRQGRRLLLKPKNEGGVVVTMHIHEVYLDSVIAKSSNARTHRQTVQARTGERDLKRSEITIQ